MKGSSPKQEFVSWFAGWLGRQVGHVKKAVQTDVTAPPAPPAPAVVYRKDNVEEVDHPTEPGVKLRRTTIDEVIVENKQVDG